MSYHEMACDAGCGPGSDWHEQMEQMAEQMHRQMIEREWEKKAEEKEIEEMEYNLRVDNDQLRADLAAARKWAKAWKMQATGERIQEEQAAKAFCDEATKRELLQESNTTLRAEIDRLKRVKSCKTCSKFLTPTHTYDSCDGCYWHNWEDGFDGHEPLDPSAAQG